MSRTTPGERAYGGQRLGFGVPVSALAEAVSRLTQERIDALRAAGHNERDVRMIMDLPPRTTAGERAHDATVADAWSTVGRATVGSVRRAQLWRAHVLATRADRIARIDSPTFAWPSPVVAKTCACGAPSGRHDRCDDCAFTALGGE